jgi:hypothetical protein
LAQIPLALAGAAPAMRPRKTGIVAARITGIRRAAVSGAARGITATMRRQSMHRDQKLLGKAGQLVRPVARLNDHHHQGTFFRDASTLPKLVN